MIGKVIGAIAGAKIAENSKSLGGPAGAAIGIVAPMVLRRLSIPGMIALGVGGYAYKKWSEKRDAEAAQPTPPVVNSPTTA